MPKHGKMFHKIKYQCFNLKSKIMEKVNKSTEIKKMLLENKSAKEISLELNTNIAYVYKLKKSLKNENN